MRGGLSTLMLVAMDDQAEVVWRMLCATAVQCWLRRQWARGHHSLVLVDDQTLPVVRVSVPVVSAHERIKNFAPFVEVGYVLVMLSFCENALLTT